MPSICLNCGTEMDDQFCPHCGQKKDVKRLTWYSFVEEVFHFFSHIEHSFLNTSYQLFIRPGRVIKEYLHGKRKSYQKPVSLYLIWSAMLLLTFKLVPNIMHYQNLRTGNSFFGSKEGGMYVVQHDQLFGLLLVPIVALVTWLITARPKMNYIETLAAMIYLSAIIQMLRFFQILITGLLFQTNFLTNGFVMQVQIVYSIWIFFAAMDLFKKDGIKWLPVRVFLSLVISFLIFQVMATRIADLILKMSH